MSRHQNVRATWAIEVASVIILLKVCKAVVGGASVGPTILEFNFTEDDGG